MANQDKTKIWPNNLRSFKQNGHKITMVTAYDFPTADMLQRAGIPVILVGDSLGNVIAGGPDTLDVTIDQMCYHTRIVRKAVTTSLLVADMPYLSYQLGTDEAIRNAARLVREGGAECLKLEGGYELMKGLMPAFHRAHIPIMGHLGLTPQSIRVLGGYRVQGRTEDQRNQMIEDAVRLQELGVCSLVLEAVPADLAAEITRRLSIPTIGIGAGPDTDGQVLVFHDLLGLSAQVPRFVRRYADLRTEINAVLQQFKQDVESGRFPSEDECYH